MSKYLVISADGHAGPPPDVYREYLDPAFREAFDQHQAELEAGRMVNTEFVEEWDEETGDHEMRAGYDPRSATPSSTRRASPPRCCSPTPTCSAPAAWPARRSARASAPVPASTRPPSRRGRSAHNRWLADFCATNPHRRIGVAVVPVTAGRRRRRGRDRGGRRRGCAA